MAYTFKTNWTDGEVLKAEDLNRVEQGIGDIFTRLDTSKNTSVTLDPGTNTVTVSKDSLFNLSGLTGRTLLNLLGRDGNFESLTGWTFTGGSGTLDASNKVYGSNAMKITLSANTGTISKSITVVAGKKYVLVADLKNGTASNAKVYATGVNGTLVTSASAFQTSYLLFAASSTTNLTIGISVSGASGQVVYADGLRLYELSDTDYSAAGLMNVTEISSRYPYTEFLSGVRNPYAIRWTDDKKTDIGAMLAFDTELLSDPVGTNADTLYQGVDGQYYKKSNWRKLTLSGNLNWVSSANLTGFKEVKIPSFESYVPQLLFATKFDGTLLEYAISNKGDVYSFDSNGTLYITLKSTDAGWGDSYTPTVEEIRAYFYGWKMYDWNKGNGVTSFNGQSGEVKGWCRRFPGTDPSQSSSYTEGSTILPTVSAAEYTPYQLMYRRSVAVVEPVASEGALSLGQGDNVIEVGSGLIIRETAKPYKNLANFAAVINNQDAQTSWLKNKARRVLTVFKNGYQDPSWVKPQDAFSYGLDRAYLVNGIYTLNDADSYTVSYLTLHNYPVVKFTGTYPNNERAITDNLIRNVAQTMRRVSVVELKKTDKDETVSWITPTLLNGWQNYNSSFSEIGYHKDSLGYVHLRGVLTGGGGNVAVLKLPVGFRPAKILPHTIGVNTNGSTDATGRVNINPVGELVYLLTNISPTIGSGGWISLANIPPFLAEL